MSVTVQDFLDSRVCKSLNMGPTDTRLYDILNEAIQRLITRDKWWGTVRRVYFCVDEDCLTLPRQVAAIESAAICNVPVTIRNHWFEFLEGGYGIRDSDWQPDPRLQIFDRDGNYCTYNDIVGDDKKIKVYADVAEDADSVILLQGYDENGNWIRTNDPTDGWIDGERVSINAGVPQTSTNFFTELTGVQKPVTNGVVRLYEYDTTLTTLRDIAVYESDETRPAYRRVYVPGLGDLAGNNGDCENIVITAMCKMAFIPVSTPRDWLLIGNIPALKDMCMSILKAERNEFGEAEIYENRAIRELKKELRHYMGSGYVQPIRMQPRNLGGAVTNMI